MATDSQTRTSRPDTPLITSPFIDPETGQVTDRTTMQIEFHLSRVDMELMLQASAYSDTDLCLDEDPPLADLIDRIRQETHSLGADGWHVSSNRGNLDAWMIEWAARQINRLWPLTD